ncbi:MAG: hypothetical protein K1000chlam2_00716 [Chlamydiae bacterium]|nr:hypothetical protein [Chlamydiota bacterium]
MGVSSVRAPFLPREVDWESFTSNKYFYVKLLCCCHSSYSCSTGEDLDENERPFFDRPRLSNTCTWLSGGLTLLGLASLVGASISEPLPCDNLDYQYFAVLVSFCAMRFFCSCTMSAAQGLGFEQRLSNRRHFATCFEFINLTLFSSAMITYRIRCHEE